MDGLIDYLEKIYSFLLNNQFPSVKLLRKGVESDFVSRKLKHYQEIKVNSELLKLFSWRNGTEHNEETNLDSMHFTPGFYLISIDEAIAFYDEMSILKTWQEGWLPFMTNGAGDFYLVDLSEKSDNYGKVIGFLRGEPEHDYEFESITSMMNSFHHAIVGDVVFITNDGYLEMNDEAFIPIAREFNPNIAFWF